jgi:hypothetical protein
VQAPSTPEGGSYRAQRAVARSMAQEDGLESTTRSAAATSSTHSMVPGTLIDISLF